MNDEIRSETPNDVLDMINRLVELEPADFGLDDEVDGVGLIEVGHGSPHIVHQQGNLFHVGHLER